MKEMRRRIHPWWRVKLLKESLEEKIQELTECDMFGRNPHKRKLNAYKTLRLRRSVKEGLE